MSSNQSKFDKKLDHAWNAGLRLREVPTFMARFGFGSDMIPQMVVGWRERKREFGCACVKRYKPKPHTSAELSQYVTVPMYGSTYGSWLGVTGPGALLRKILADDREQSKENV